MPAEAENTLPPRFVGTSRSWMSVSEHCEGAGDSEVCGTAGIFSASLSTISAALNSLAAIMLEDYLKPLYRKFKGREFSPSKSASIVKVLAFIIGIVSIALAFLAQFVSGVVQAIFTVLGVIGSPMLGIFTLGMATESATEGGTIVGALTAFSFLCWIVFGQPRPVPPKLPTTIEGCDKNSTNMTIFIVQNVINFSKEFNTTCLQQQVTSQTDPHKDKRISAGAKSKEQRNIYQ
ncbi:PREDICTED: putative sodium-dependent multivitamin transporter [Cyphomyrmex costatus]|uniref:putative sodium-dependent multivitamin transporter n=1 Tax=Cyphomyrmex costatus TaxID=456900 RepID=UPI000852356A|nr:PREDICTED: putative sodium-dependent multivitamin transporter [Cyphomyrmex costatus]